ncbi:methylated-DNA--[protein]-cysteine S-methyltransferase [Thiohalobacter sp. COW1]|uniref:methylated-DNA--[protein]-cysteine S-methyltransferase n=1 Tax=Thiohalobacter thiocyanaticus TaxID=585455 RepID=A0A1Z4VT75_9GAMM|nr:MULTISPECIES: methylated-DNA--[protein]-cysteine S-methyltransferase [Thiohalobacter]BAZ94836.1 cysteine methyltransferase [Thiohalobacter thiocyanaticus]BCO33241.1 methylated-DNA--[protein]-cysteine S-methyltransferase [Thiohalobacter sp. COW1]
MKATPLPDAIEYAAVHASPVGWLGIRLDGHDRLRGLELLEQPPRRQPVASAAAPVLAALEAYFAAPASALNLPELAPLTTAFQQRLRQALLAIPAGTVLTYAELAARLGSAPRAVGQACRRNPIPVLVPCHRVVARTGIGGYAGATSGPRLAMKQWLLAHEGYPGA